VLSLAFFWSKKSRNSSSTAGVELEVAIVESLTVKDAYFFPPEPGGAGRDSYTTGTTGWGSLH
jgi:hypothetical protein